MCRLVALQLDSGALRQRRERQYRGTGVETTEIVVQGGQKGRRGEGQAPVESVGNRSSRSSTVGRGDAMQAKEEKEDQHRLR